MPTQNLTLAFLKEFARDYRTTIANLINENGDVFMLKGPFHNFHFFINPSYIGHVLYSNSKNYVRPINEVEKYLQDPTMNIVEINTRWLNARATMLNSLMTEKLMKRYIDSLVQNVANQLNSWEPLAHKQEPVAIYKKIEMLAVSNLSKTLLGGAPIDNEHVIEIVDEVMILLFASELSITKLPWILPTHTKRRTQYVMKELLNICDTVLRHCFSDNSPDFHGLLEVKKKYGALYLQNQLDERTKLFLRGVTAAFIMGGFETLSRSLTLAFAYLSKFPIIADTISKEFQDKIGKGRINSHNIDLLSYSRATGLEVLRYSGGVLPLLVRKALKDDRIENYKIKKNDRIFIPAFYLMGMNKYWENPQGLDPGHFLKPLGDSYRFVFLPFGTGWHSCLGRNFATLQSTIVLSTLTQKYRLSLAPYQDINPDNPAPLKVIIHNLLSEK